MKRLRIEAAALALKRVQDLQNGNIIVPGAAATPTTVEGVKDKVMTDITNTMGSKLAIGIRDGFTDDPAVVAVINALKSK